MKEESLLLLSDLQKLINQVVLIDYTIIILGGENSAMAVEPENPAWARNARSSPRGVMTLTWRRGVVIVY